MTDKSVIPSLKSDHFPYVDSHNHFLLRLARHMEPSQDLNFCLAHQMKGAGSHHYI